MRHAGMQVIMGKGGRRTSGILRKLRLLRADCIFLCFLHFMQKKRRFRGAKMQSVEPQCFSRHSSATNKKDVPFGTSFLLVEISGIEPLTS